MRRSKPASAEAVRGGYEPVAALGAQMKEKNRVLQQFLAKRMYRHPKVLDAMARAQRVIGDLFAAYMNDPAKLPKDWREDALADDRSRFARQVCDFIAGMTDRYALQQHRQLFGLEPLFR